MSDGILVAGSLVRHLRSGLRRELGFAAQHIATLMLELEDEPPAGEYEQSLETFDTARALLSDIGPASDQSQPDIELDLSANASLVLRALECQHNSEVDCLQQAALYGPVRDAASEEVRALGDLVMVVKRHVQRQRRHQAEHRPVRARKGARRRR